MGNGNSQIVIDKKSGLARVIPGLRLGNLITELAKEGLAASTGTCANVGASQILVGGIGQLARLQGVMTDRLVEFDILLADGRIITASPRRHADLFLACSGAGAGNFGLVTSFTVRVGRVKRCVLFQTSWRTADTASIFASFQAATQTAPKRFAGFELNYLAGDGTLSVVGLYIPRNTESDDDAEKTVRHFIKRDLGTKSVQPVEQSVKVTTYEQAAAFFSGRPPVFFFLKVKSNFVLTPIPANGARKIIDFMRKSPFSSVADGRVRLEFDAFGGRANEHTDRTVIAGKQTDTIGWLALFIQWTKQEDEQRALHYITRLHNVVQPFVSRFAYYGAVDSQLVRPLRAYFGKHVPFLRRVKTKYDPNNVFKFQQSIPPLRTR